MSGLIQAQTLEGAPARGWAQCSEDWWEFREGQKVLAYLERDRAPWCRGRLWHVSIVGPDHCGGGTVGLLRAKGTARQLLRLWESHHD